MKRKSFLFSILAVLLCLSLVLVGCGGGSNADDDNDDNNGGDSVDAKQVVIDALSEKSLSDLFDIGSLTSDAANGVTAEDIVDIIREISCETNVNATFEGESGNVYVGVDDGYVKVNAGNGNEAWGKFTDDGTFIMFVKEGSSFVESERMYIVSDLIEMMNPMGMIMGGEAQDGSVKGILQTVMDFKLPEISADDLELEDGYYMLQDGYYDEFIDTFTDMLADLVEDMGEASPSDDEIKEQKDMFNDMIDALGLNIGFKVKGENIVGYIMSIDADIEALENIEGLGGEDVELDYTSASEDLMEIKLEVALNSSATALESMDIYANIVAEGETMLKMDADVKVDDSKIELNINDFRADGVTFEANAVIEFIKNSNGELVGLDMSIDAAAGGDLEMELSGDLYINSENLSKPGSKFFELDFSYKADGQSISATADADVTSVGAFTFGLSCKSNGSTLISANGNANFNSADLGTIPNAVKNAA